MIFFEITFWSGTCSPKSFVFSLLDVGSEFDTSKSSKENTKDFDGPKSDFTVQLFFLRAPHSKQHNSSCRASILKILDVLKSYAPPLASKYHFYGATTNITPAYVRIYIIWIYLRMWTTTTSLEITTFIIFLSFKQRERSDFKFLFIILKLSYEHHIQGN